MKLWFFTEALPDEEVEESLSLAGVEGWAPNLLSVCRVFFLACTLLQCKTLMTSQLNLTRLSFNYRKVGVKINVV